MLDEIKKWAGFALETVFFVPLALYRSVKFEMALTKLARTVENVCEHEWVELESLPVLRCVKCGAECDLQREVRFISLADEEMERLNKNWPTTPCDCGTGRIFIDDVYAGCVKCGKGVPERFRGFSRGLDEDA